MKDNITRRKFLFGAAVAGSLSLSGCLDDVEEETRPQYSVSSIDPPAQNATVYRTIDSTQPGYGFRVSYDTSFPDHEEPAHIFLRQERDIIEGVDYDGEETVTFELSDSDPSSSELKIVCSTGEEEFGEVTFVYDPVEREESEE